VDPDAQQAEELQRVLLHSHQYLLGPRTDLCILTTCNIPLANEGPGLQQKHP